MPPPTRMHQRPVPPTALRCPESNSSTSQSATKHHLATCLLPSMAPRSTLNPTVPVSPPYHKALPSLAPSHSRTDPSPVLRCPKSNTSTSQSATKHHLPTCLPSLIPPRTTLNPTVPVSPSLPKALYPPTSMHLRCGPSRTTHPPYDHSSFSTNATTYSFLTILELILTKPDPLFPTQPTASASSDSLPRHHLLLA